MEPSCLAVFRDELTRELPHDEDARRLTRNAYHFPEFFRTFGISPPRYSGDALLWGHCHQKATGGMAPERELLPAVRQAEKSTLVVAEGFSCRTQIEHAGTGRTAFAHRSGAAHGQAGGRCAGAAFGMALAGATAIRATTGKRPL